MNRGLNPHEARIAREQSCLCDSFVEKDDLVFFYPSKFVGKGYADAAETLQHAMDFLKYVTTDKDPTQYFDSRVVIRWIKDRKKTNISYCTSDKKTGKGHWIDLSWEFLSKPNQFYERCAHELVHPFYRISPLHTRDQPWGGNEGWGEGFCDFLRGPVMNRIGLHGEDLWWNMINKPAKRKEAGVGWGPAEQFIKMARDRTGGELNQFVRWFINNNDAIREFVDSLFRDFADRPLSDVLRPTLEMERRYRCKGMI